MVRKLLERFTGVSPYEGGHHHPRDVRQRKLARVEEDVAAVTRLANEVAEGVRSGSIDDDPIHDYRRQQRA